MQFPDPLFPPLSMRSSLQLCLFLSLDEGTWGMKPQLASGGEESWQLEGSTLGHPVNCGE